MTIEHPWMRVITPFIRTPVNIVKFGAARLPLGLLMPSVREDLSGRNGPLAKQLAYTRIVAGSSVAMGVVMAAVAGNITGGGPDDPKEKAVKYAGGWQPYSVKFGDTYYAYGRLEPLGIVIGMAADFAEISQRSYMDDVTAGDIAHMMTAAIANNLTNKTFLSGLSSLVEAWNDPERYGKTYLQGMVGTLIPTISSDVARLIDPELKEVNGYMDKLRSRTPGKSQELFPRRDIFGEPITLGGSAPQIPGSSMVSPIYVSEDKKDPVVEAMIEVGASPGRPSKRIENVELEPAEYDAYAMQSGQLARQKLERVVGGRGWDRLDSDRQRDKIMDAYRDARSEARAKVLAQFDGLRQRVRQARAER
jgi:hypothetical protein